jgi:hypothetical protein
MLMQALKAQSVGIAPTIAMVVDVSTSNVPDEHGVVADPVCFF